MSTKGRQWTRDELIIAFNLYCSIPFGKMHRGNPVIIELARGLKRTPSSLAMKLVNFASLDPTEKARGIKGLSGASASDRAIWNEFHKDWNRLGLESEQALRNIAADLPTVKKEFIDKIDSPSDISPETPT